MKYFITRCPTDLGQILYQYLLKDFHHWNVRRMGNKIFLHPSIHYCFTLNSFHSWNLFQIMVSSDKKIVKQKKVPFIDIQSQIYKFYFQYIVLCEISNKPNMIRTLYQNILLQLATNDLSYCRNILSII